MKKIHFIGIGGIGISALARYYKSIGYAVSGSDMSQSDLLKDLQNEGITINIGCKSENVLKDVEKVIYTIAIKKDENDEFLEAKKLQGKNPEIKILSYPEALGEMTNSKKVIAVCGTHGKTTTTAMIYFALQNVGVDVSMIVGSLIDWQGGKTNYVYGKSEWIIIEACEYKESFLNYNPDIILVTNIDADHLDFYKDLDHIKNSFQKFVNKIKPNGSLIVHKNEDFLVVGDGISKYISEENVEYKNIELSVPGEHNRKNASLTMTLGKVLNLDIEKIKIGLKNFKGTWRRQEYKGKILENSFENIFYDDYAHHPTEIKATINAFREKFSNDRMIVSFMPHLFSRTKILFSDFVQVLNMSDEIILLPIYKARETDDGTIKSEMLNDEINKISQMEKSITVKNLEELRDKILEKTKEEGNKLFIILGAGNIADVYNMLKLEK